jgi:hypothetical protein
MNKDKYIYFFLNTVEFDINDPGSCITYNGTKKAISENWWCIYTTSLVNLSFDLLDKGYKIYLTMNGIDLRLRPEMKGPDGEGIKRTDNILDIVLSGYFNKYFEEGYVTEE